LVVLAASTANSSISPCELLDLALHGRVLDDLAGHAHGVDVRQGVGHAGDVGEVLARALATLARLDVEDLDGGHTRGEPGVPVVHLDEVAAVPVPDARAARHRVERIPYRLERELHAAVGGDVAASPGEEVEHPGVRIELHSRLAHQLEGRIDDAPGLGLRQRIVGGRIPVMAGRLGHDRPFLSGARRPPYGDARHARARHAAALVEQALLCQQRARIDGVFVEQRRFGAEAEGQRHELRGVEDRALL
jgi:hypothetical protein